MSNQITESKAVPMKESCEKSMITGFSKSSFSQTVGLLIRVFQVFFSILVIGLTANATRADADGATIYSLIVSIISLLYLVFLLGFSFFKPQCLNVGAIIIFEGFLLLLFLGSFIALAVIAGQWTCEGYGYYFLDDFTSFGDFNSTPCKTGKAAIAFIGASWVLYCFSSVIFIVNVLDPVAKLDGNAVFKFLKVNGVKLDYSVLNVTNWGPLDTTSKLDEEQVVGIEEVKSAAAPAAPAAPAAAAPAAAPAATAPAAAPAAAPATVVLEEPEEPVEPEEPFN